MPFPRTAAFFAVSSIAMAATAAVPAWADLSPANLRCEYKVDPTAVNGEHPRLYWRVESRERGQWQTAYQVLVASSREGLDRNQGDLWDTGRVASGETLHLAYAGTPLASGQQAFWKVRVWDRDGKASGWSKSATWTAGLKQPGDWAGARWIGYPTPPVADTLPLTGAKWIWFAGDGNDPPATKRWFRRTLTLPANIASARLAITADDEYTLIVNGKRHLGPRGTDAWKSYKPLDLTGELVSGENTLIVEATNTTQGPAGLIARLVVRTTDGQTSAFVTDGAWEAGSTERGTFTPVRVLGSLGAAPWGDQVNSSTANAMTPPPYFRRPFTLEAKPIRRALLYATALGVYELSLNGKQVSNDLLSPGWTDYRKRVHYLAYDVTKQVKSGGDNVLGAILGDGWYASFLGYTGRRHFYGGDPRLRLLLRVEYTDGTRAAIGTDENWKTSYGPLLYADMLMGVSDDTRREMPGWNAPGFNDADWKPALVATEEPTIAVEAQPNEPIRPTETRQAQSRTEPKPGVFVYDFGQNLSGWVRLKVNGKPGQTITLRHAERLNPDGTIYTTNLRAARATDTFILRGGPQTLEPRFTFHGFQYVEITGLDDARPGTRDVAAVAFHSDLERTGRFDSSNKLLNKLTENIDWGQRGNYLDVPTDCPQRDERLGWTGDAQVFAKTAMFNRNAAPFFSKWLFDLVEDGQASDGSLPDVAPRVGGGGNAAWEDAGVICTYRQWEMYGDTRVIEEHWDSLTRYMDHLKKVAPNGIRSVGAFGDWLLLDGPQKSDIHGTAYYFYCARLMAKMAAATGRAGDATGYALLADKIRNAFTARFVTADGRVEDNGKTSQTFYALALAWDLLPAEKREAAAKNLVSLIDARGGKLATGFIGTPVLLPALTGAGRADTAYKLLLSEEYPSWLYQIKLGATTTWERWDGWTPDKGFQNPGMNSFNHYWLGCVGEWLFTDGVGMDTDNVDGVGWKRINFRPQFTDRLSHAHYAYDSIRGRIEAGWKRDSDGTITYTVTLPANTSGTVYLPAAPNNITIDGRAMPGIAGNPKSRTEIPVVSGRTVFRFPIIVR